jgi:hypothetical protein
MAFRILSLTLCAFMLQVTSPAGAQDRDLLLK